MSKGRLYAKYVSVIVNGQLDAWTGPNPDKDPRAVWLARVRASNLRGAGFTAYAVVIQELTDQTEDALIDEHVQIF